MDAAARGVLCLGSMTGMIDTPMATHRDRTPRFDLAARARIKLLPGGVAFDAEIGNVSERGLLVRADAAAASKLGVSSNGARIGIELHTTESNHALSMLGEVVWHAEGRFGVKIVGIAPPHSIRFLRIVDRARERASTFPPPTRG